MQELFLDSSYDNLQLSVAVSFPSDTPKGIVQLVHGMCEHKERYYPLMDYLTNKGFVVIIHDHRGHGASVKSSDHLGYMYEGGWEALVDDVKVVNEFIRKKYPSLTLSLLGHSMGSMVVRSFVKRYPELVDRLIVCGSPSRNPMAKMGRTIASVISKFKGEFYRPMIMQNMSFGAYNKPFRKEGWASGWVCSDPDILKEYHADPLCQFVFTCNGWISLMNLMIDCYNTSGWKVTNPSMNIMFISGKDDPCRGSEAAFKDAVSRMKKVGYTNVISKVYPQMRHEILNETDKAFVWDDVVRFCKSRIV